MQRKVQPPDFRYVCLAPGPSTTATTLAVGTFGTASVGYALWSASSHSYSIGLMLCAGAVMAIGFARDERRVRANGRGAAVPRDVAMAIVPWGVIEAPDTNPRVLRWPAIREVTVDVRHRMRGGTPAVVSSRVTVYTEREALAGCAPGAVNLERLVANLSDYADEAARPAARDLDGNEAAGDDATEPVAGLLIRFAEELCASGMGAARLALPAGGYRTVALKKAAPETLAELHAALDADLDAPADPRPLAAIAAGLLGATELVPDLLRLVSSPHPMVAAFAKAAALRLGAPRSRAGSFEELGAFLFEEDLEAIRAWAAQGSAGYGPGEIADAG